MIAFVMLSAPARADEESVSGKVTLNGVPVAGATVIMLTAAGSVSATTAQGGTFYFNEVSEGEHVIHAAYNGYVADKRITVPDGGLTGIELRLEKSSQQPRYIAVVTARSPNAVAGAGTSVVLTGEQLLRNTAVDDFSKFLARLPAAAGGVNGNVYVNGSPSPVSLTMDGVPVPIGLSRELVGSTDADDIQYTNVIEGAFPAQIGGTSSAAIDVATITETGPPRVAAQLTGGSLATAGNELAYHAPLGSRGTLQLQQRAYRSGWMLDPPDLAGSHDSGSLATEMIRAYYNLSDVAFLKFVGEQTYQTFEVPTGASATGAYQNRDDRLFSLRYTQSRSARSAFSAGLLASNSALNDSSSTPAIQPLFCGLIHGQCVSAFAGSRRLTTGTVDATYSNAGPLHAVAAGVSMSPSRFSGASTLGFGASSSTVNSGRSRLDASAYLQDTYQFRAGWSIDYGLRGDWSGAYSQLSPRIKVTRTFDSRSNVYTYYGRLFEPFPPNDYFTAPADSAIFGSPFDLHPQSDSLYEIGGHAGIGQADLGLRLWHKDSADALDTALIPATNAGQDINFRQGTVDAQSLYLAAKSPHGSQDYLSVTHGLALIRGCIPSGPFVCDGFPNGWVSADYDQRWTASAGQTISGRRSWLTWDAQYGNGIQSPQCTGCGGAAHVTFDVGTGLKLAPQSSIELVIRNLLNDRYAITAIDELEGPHYSTPRSFELNFRMGQ